MAVAPDGLVGIGLIDEGVVGGDGAVIEDAVDLAVGTLEVLGEFAAASFADGEEEVLLAVGALGGEDEAAAVVDVAAGLVLRFRGEDGLLAGPGVVLDLAADDLGEGDGAAVLAAAWIAE